MKEYKISIDKHNRKFRYFCGDQHLAFELDSQAKPMVLFMDKCSLGDGEPMRPLTEEEKETVCPRIMESLIKNQTKIKVSYTGLKTPRKKK